MATQARETQHDDTPTRFEQSEASVASEAENQNLPVKAEKELHAADPTHWFERDPLWFKRALF
jgi:maltose alpha-D-glucosyltransferase/alpha-amylase